MHSLIHSLIFIMTAIVGLALLTGWIYQHVATAGDRKRHPGPGEMFDLQSHRLHLLSMGRGSPAVILESGLMSTVLSWENVQAEIAKSTRAVSYDRAGLGWSDPGPAPRDAEQIVSELHRLLERAHVSPPFILVGHSFGGLVTQILLDRGLGAAGGGGVQLFGGGTGGGRV